MSVCTKVHTNNLKKELFSITVKLLIGLGKVFLFDLEKGFL